ncbi:hypothetical protein SCHPADRAFT_944136 [Schizopora paradoxa]|uniref:Membrane anchor Opy2 N-terminal domain-containing protein n=1 Tax=Schizopora paradoxa TaxID=27342 RepID=A0A0H2RAD7_9AGAM|nr:hypothetical protein SCHPADRAFT_944136 [Schizopora paradoxa]
MQLNDFPLFARDDCVPCPTTPPPCSCGPNQQCVTILQGCNSCATPKCVDTGSSSSGGGKGVSAGAIAGGVIGAIALVGVLAAAFFWYRRRSRTFNAESGGAINQKPDVPASADAVLQREDPYEKDSRVNTMTPAVQEAYQRYNEMMVLAQQQQQATQYASAGAPPAAGPSLDRRQSDGTSVLSDPFKDNQSIQTTSASTQSTNVIPIHLVPHGSIQSSPQSPTSDGTSQSSSAPSRPARAPDLNIDPLNSTMNLEHVNVSKESFRPPNVPYAHSQASGFSGISNRTSVLSTGTYASDLLSEAPQIVTPASGAVRQFLGVAKAEVILAPGSNPSTPGSNYSARTPSVSRAVRSPLRSPLAQSSFGPGDSVAEEGQDIDYPIRNPFSDENSFVGRSPTGSASTGMPTPVPLPSTASPTRHTHITESDATSRPLSTATAAGSIIAADIGSATLVRLGSNASNNSALSARSQNRFTSAKLVSPMSAPLRQEDDGVMQAQQAQALALARARAEASGLPGPGLNRRISEAGSVASNGGFSILESFTFVPPSPISSLPPRSPSSQRQITPELSSGPSTASNRQVQGMSTASNGSALAGYDFRIDTGSLPVTPNTANIMQEEQQQRAQPAPAANSSTQQPPAPAKQNSAGKPQRQRASLDTLALTADLSAFPLSFDEGLRDSFANLTSQVKK